MIIKHLRTFSQWELLWLHWSGIKSRTTPGHHNSGSGWAKLSWCTLVRGKAIHTLINVQEGIRTVLDLECARSVLCWDYSIVENSGIAAKAWWRHWNINWKGASVLFSSFVTAAPSSAWGGPECLTWDSPKLFHGRVTAHNTLANPKLCFLLSAAVTLCTLQVSRDKICFCQIRLILTATLEREGELKDSKFSVVKGFKSEVQGPNNSFSEYYVTIKTWKNCPVSWRAEIMSGGFPENILIGLFGHIPLVTQSTFQNCPVLTLEVANSLLASSL